jgi:hypothetical protein
MKKSIFLCLMIFSGFVNAQTNTALISVDKITLHSDILNEERIVTVHLPDNYYNCEEEDSVLYVFDSPYNLTPVIGLVCRLPLFSTALNYKIVTDFKASWPE